MEIAINACHGGFGLSDKAFEHYLQLKNIPYETQPSKWAYREDSKDYYAAGHVGDDNYYLHDRDIDRNDPALIQTIKDLGEKANDRFSQLRIVLIPDDVKWEIGEYDGYEHVAEQHRRWYA